MTLLPNEILSHFCAGDTILLAEETLSTFIFWGIVCFGF